MPRLRSDGGGWAGPPLAPHPRATWAGRDARGPLFVFVSRRWNCWEAGKRSTASPCCRVCHHAVPPCSAGHDSCPSLAHPQHCRCNCSRPPRTQLPLLPRRLPAGPALRAQALPAAGETASEPRRTARRLQRPPFQRPPPPPSAATRCRALRQRPVAQASRLLAAMTRLLAPEAPVFHPSLHEVSMPRGAAAAAGGRGAAGGRASFAAAPALGSPPSAPLRPCCPRPTP